jgi:hypothetical protein
MDDDGQWTLYAFRGRMANYQRASDLGISLGADDPSAEMTVRPGIIEVRLPNGRLICEPTALPGVCHYRILGALLQAQVETVHIRYENADD